MVHALTRGAMRSFGDLSARCRLARRGSPTFELLQIGALYGIDSPPYCGRSDMATKKTTKKSKTKAPTSSSSKAKSSPPSSSSKAKASSPKASGADGKKAPSHAVPSRPQIEPKAHVDAGLTKKQVQTLYEKLMSERDRVVQGHGAHLSDAISNVDPLSDEMDVAQRHTEQAYLMRFADKERKLLVQITNALEKLELGDYGVCEGTGEPIAYKRLELRPWTRYSVEYKEQVERERKQHQR